MQLRVASIAFTKTPNSFYRSVGPLNELVRRGHLVQQIFPPDGPPNTEALNGCNVLHVHRYTDGDAFAAMRWASRSGIPVVWDNDDDMIAPRGGTRRNGRDRHAADHRYLVGTTRRTLRLVDLATAPSDDLARTFADAGARRVSVVENYLPGEFIVLRRPARLSPFLTIGWIAALEHEADARDLGLTQVLRRLMDAHPSVRVATLGVNLGLPTDRYRHAKPMPFSEVGPWAASFDIGIAPLADTRFNRARSNIKLKEYAGAGTPWLASPVGPYVGMGESEGGRLVENDRWLEELERLVANAEERQRLGTNGSRWARSQTLVANGEKWEQMLLELVDR